MRISRFPILAGKELDYEEGGKKKISRLIGTVRCIDRHAKRHVRVLYPVSSPYSSTSSISYYHRNMAKLASSRDFRMYGARRLRNRWEYINAALYVFSAILLVSGFLSQFSNYSKSSGLVLLLIALTILAAVNAHDLMAHLAGIDYRFSLLLLDYQLALVEVAAPLVQMLGSVVVFFGILLLFLQASGAKKPFSLPKNLN